MTADIWLIFAMFAQWLVVTTVTVLGIAYILLIIEKIREKIRGY